MGNGKLEHWYNWKRRTPDAVNPATTRWRSGLPGFPLNANLDSFYSIIIVFVSSCVLIKLIADVKNKIKSTIHRPSVTYTRTKWRTLVKPVWDSIEERQLLSCVGQANSFTIWRSLVVNVVVMHKHLQQIEGFFIQTRCSIQHCKRQHPSDVGRSTDVHYVSHCMTDV